MLWRNRGKELMRYFPFLVEGFLWIIFLVFLAFSWDDLWITELSNTPLRRSVFGNYFYSISILFLPFLFGVMSVKPTLVGFSCWYVQWKILPISDVHGKASYSYFIIDCFGKLLYVAAILRNNVRVFLFIKLWKNYSS